LREQAKAKAKKMKRWLFLLAAAGGLGCAGRQAAGTACLDGRGSDNPEALARVIRTGMRTAMLAGDGLTIRDFMDNLTQATGELQVSIFASTGEQVYLAKPPPPDRRTLPALVQKVLADRQTARAGQGELAFAMTNDEACRRCHPNGNMRAVVSLELKTPLADDQTLLAMGRVARSAFEALMTVGKSQAVDDYLQALPKEFPQVTAASVFSLDGHASIGDGFLEVPPPVLQRALSPGEPFIADGDGGSTLVAIGLPNHRRCQSCHKASEMRGALVMKLKSRPTREEAAVRLVSASVRHVMLTGLGRLSKKFLDQVAASGLADRVTVHDAEGRVFHDTQARPTPPPFIAAALADGQPSRVADPRGNGTLFILPVRNEDKCRRCHDEEGGVRAVVAVSSRR
jgi:hypothetical protein